MGSLQHFLPGAQPLCLRGRIQDAVSPPWFLLKEAMSDDRTVGPSASEVVVNWGRLVKATCRGVLRKWRVTSQAE